MKNFEDFKAEREKTDPSAKNMSEQQWQQAYAAYRRTRERSRGRRSGGGERGGGERGGRERGDGDRRRETGRSGGPGLRGYIRRHTAYADTRSLVDVLVWLSVGFAVIAGVVSLQMYGDATGGTFAVMKSAFQVAAVLAVRLGLHVVIDLADIALYRAESSGDSGAAGETGGRDEGGTE